MKYTIKNEYLTVTVDSNGAELTSMKSRDDVEYLWQGDPDIWTGHAPNLFPYIARLTDQKYVLDGKEYYMKIHGIIKYTELSVDEQGEDYIVFRLDSNEETLKQYPFQFVYKIVYRVWKNELIITNIVENKDEKRMYFGVGGHPGFNVPLEEGLSFEDYVLEFAEECKPSRVGFTENCFLDGTQEKYELKANRQIALRHELFDNDAIVLKNAAKTVRICSPKGTRSVEINYPDFENIGFWHKPKYEAPYVCVEPWSSLPSRQDIVENFAQQSDLISLDAGKTYENTWSVKVF